MGERRSGDPMAGLFSRPLLGSRTKGPLARGLLLASGNQTGGIPENASGPLKDAAEDLDQALRQAKYRTILHGDAKIANFCFSTSGTEVAAVDFQYIGGGVGVKDLAYFVSSCYYEEECQALEEQILGTYFVALRQSVARWHPSVEFTGLEDSWRQLYPVAWADFSRFLQGWSPGHWKLHRYSRSMVQRALNQL
jgi:aminoglycoside phosphotransferase (APT) family kinase protein